MKKKFVTNLALLLTLNLLIKPFWIFGIDRSMQNVVGAEQYGMYFSLFSFSIMLNILLDIGITNYNNRNIAQNSNLLSKYLSNVVILKFILAIVYFLVCIIVALSIGYHWDQLKLLFLLMLNQFLISFTLYLRSNLSGLHFFKTDSLLSVLDKAIMIVLCSALLWGNVFDEKISIHMFVYTQTIAYGVTAAITFLIVISKSDFLKLKFDLGFFIIFLKQSYPYALLILLMALYSRIDSVMLERLLPDGMEQAGIYAQAFRILDAVSMFAFLFAGLLLPMFARMIKQKQAIDQLTLFSFALIIVPVLIIVITTFTFRNEIINLLYVHHVENSADILGTLMLGFVFISTSYIFGTLLTANGSMRELNIMAFTGMIINILLNLILIPRYQAKGSAVAGLVTQAFTAITQVLISKKVFSFRINYRFLLTLGLFLIIAILSGYAVKKIEIDWTAQLIILISFTGVMAIALKLINLRSLISIIRQKEEMQQ